ncbi:ESCRT-0 subunit protein hse1 [Dispira parvispora]|uniref:ESCRT-0 subunit protein hse1 n=1 Tax=Dispira parvispora TaxID=1520584 RepID=A0A9W8E2T9_9FUNG|nr:ESCRT-0 subunit protein hse1 [Dispira parvispora]
MEDMTTNHILVQTWKNIRLLLRVGWITPEAFESISRRLPPCPSEFDKTWNPFPGGGMGRFGPPPPNSTGGRHPFNSAGGMPGEFRQGGRPGGFGDPSMADRMAYGARLRRSHTAAPRPHPGFGGGMPRSPMGGYPAGGSMNPQAGMDGYGGQGPAGMGSHPRQDGGNLPYAPGGGLPRFVRVLFDYHGSSPGLLTINRGDMIEVLDAQHSPWWTGVLRGVTGLFPATYTKAAGQGMEEFAHEAFDRLNINDPTKGFGPGGHSPRPRSAGPSSPHPGAGPGPFNGSHDPSFGPMGPDMGIPPTSPHPAGLAPPGPYGPGGGHSPRPSQHRHSFVDSIPGMHGRPPRSASAYPTAMSSGGPGMDLPPYGPMDPNLPSPGHPMAGGPGVDPMGNSASFMQGPGPTPYGRRNSFQPGMMGRQPGRRSTPGPL